MINKYDSYNYNPIQLKTSQKIPFRTIFQAKSGGFSSKRVCGFLGWIVIMFCCIWCVIKGTDAPDFITELIIGCASLLGVDSIGDAIGGLKGQR